LTLLILIGFGAVIGITIGTNWQSARRWTHLLLGQDGDYFRWSSSRKHRLDAIAAALHGYLDRHGKWPRSDDDLERDGVDLDILLASPEMAICDRYTIRYADLHAEGNAIIVFDPGYGTWIDPPQQGITSARLDVFRYALVKSADAVYPLYYGHGASSLLDFGFDPGADRARCGCPDAPHAEGALKDAREATARRIHERRGWRPEPRDG
jgi:hypothetical protein